MKFCNVLNVHLDDKILECDILICSILLSMDIFLIFSDIARKTKEDKDQLFSCTEGTEGKIFEAEGMIDSGMLIKRCVD